MADSASLTLICTEAIGYRPAAEHHLANIREIPWSVGRIFISFFRVKMISVHGADDLLLTPVGVRWRSPVLPSRPVVVLRASTTCCEGRRPG
ncbi:hypothetical protein [Thermomonospora echinospora]|uniref:hypothetical protein n=1 Tax=Thermomonospora echinospora TaxID=1992 RepID=UPI000CDEBCC5|nr:hypothetical protein [Thermomonospora echinospora]